jgi:hypothetical protein
MDGCKLERDSHQFSFRMTWGIFASVLTAENLQDADDWMKCLRYASQRKKILGKF